MAALSIHADYTYLSVSGTRDQMETCVVNEAVVSGDVIAPSNTAGFGKAGNDPVYYTGLVIRPAAAGRSAPVVPIRSGYVVVGYDLSGLAFGDPVYVNASKIDDTSPGVNNVIAGRVEYHPTAPGNKALRIL